MNDIEFIFLTHVQQHLSGDLKHRKKNTYIFCIRDS